VYVTEIAVVVVSKGNESGCGMVVAISAMRKDFFFFVLYFC
jgi:hypothetical protein